MGAASARRNGSGERLHPRGEGEGEGRGAYCRYFFHPRERRCVEKPLTHSFEPRFESRKPDAAKRRLALGVGTESRQDPTESRAADQG